ncbi:hypothetical protein C8R46DRAFT_1093703 [Mycena filopes]|nr:hypothetical protein C8R46DRAFT_1093703 [Mycena filopes]
MSNADLTLNCLPVEITTAIFAFCLPTVKELREIMKLVVVTVPRHSRRPTSWLGVCRTWRDIAFATPFLWTTSTSLERGRVEEYVDRWLGRAGLQPLTFVFCLEQEAEPDFDVPSPVRCMRDVIRRYSDRLQELELELTAAYFDIGILGLDSIHFPLLERAILGEFNLRPGTWLLCYTPPWTQLTEVQRQRYVARSEISLALLGSYIDGLTNMLDALTLPALVSLHISLSVSLPSLLSFLASRIRGPSAEFLSCILRLGLSAQSQRRLPHLQDLSILESPAVNHEQLVNFLYQRSTSNDLVRLQSFRLLHRFGTPPDEVEELIAGKYETEDGIDIRIRRGETGLVSCEESGRMRDLFETWPRRQ